jgi:hypothetical protein
VRLCAVGQRYSVCESYVIKYISVSFESFDVGRRDRAAASAVARRPSLAGSTPRERDTILNRTTRTPMRTPHTPGRARASGPITSRRPIGYSV